MAGKYQYAHIWDTFDQDDEVMSQVNSLPTEYYNMIAPYLTYTYKPSVFDVFFGRDFRTGGIKARENAQAVVREKLAAIQAEIQQNRYNSPASQVARQKDAGLNSDLLGTGDVEGASQLDQPSNASATDVMPDFGSSPIDDVQAAFEGALQIATSSLSAADTLSQLKIRRLNLEQLDIGNSEDMMNYIVSKYSHIPPQQLQDAIAKGFSIGDDPSAIIGDGETDGGMLDPSFVSARKPLSVEFSTPEANKRYSKMIKSFKDSPQALDAFYKAQNEMYKSRLQNQTLRINEYTMSDIDAVNNDRIEYLSKQESIRTKYQAKAAAVTAKLAAITAENDEAYQELCKEYNLPDNLAKADLAKAIASHLQAAFEKDNSAAKQEWLRQLHAKYMRGNAWAGYNYMYYMNQAPLPNFQGMVSYGVGELSDRASDALTGNNAPGDPNGIFSPDFIGF